MMLSFELITLPFELLILPFDYVGLIFDSVILFFTSLILPPVQMIFTNLYDAESYIMTLDFHVPAMFLITNICLFLLGRNYNNFHYLLLSLLLILS